MYLRMITLLLIVVIPRSGGSQTLDQARLAQTAPWLGQQRNAALDALAVCAGDLDAAQRKLRDLEEAKKEKKE